MFVIKYADQTIIFMTSSAFGPRVIYQFGAHPSKFVSITLKRISAPLTQRKTLCAIHCPGTPTISSKKLLFFLFSVSRQFTFPSIQFCPLYPLLRFFLYLQLTVFILIFLLPEYALKTYLSLFSVISPRIFLHVTTFRKRICRFCIYTNCPVLPMDFLEFPAASAIFSNIPFCLQSVRTVPTKRSSKTDSSCQTQF